MKKYKLLIIGFLISIFLLIPINTKAYTNIGKDPDTRFNAVNEAMYNSFAGSNYFTMGESIAYVKYLVDGSKIWPVYCGELPIVFSEGSTDFTPTGASDLGIQYIIKNGFQASKDGNESYYYSTHSGCTQNSCSAVLGIRTNSPKQNQPWYVNYWLTQMAIWVYHNPTSYVSDFVSRLNSASNLTEDERIIKSLVDGANATVAAANQGTTTFNNVNPDFSVSDNILTLDGDYYYSKIISVTGVYDNFTVSTNKDKFKIPNIYFQL